MEHTNVEDIDSYGNSGNEFRRLSEALGTEGLAINYYKRAPDETIGDCYHRHHEQEEVFYIITGVAAFDTEEGEVTVEGGELIRFAPGEWQQGRNQGNTPLEVLALGAPREQGATDLQRECPECEKRTPVEVKQVEDEWLYICGVCGAETGQAT
jgi:mannose-6-phosphate isomerase-like protein (cupin superfamily)